MNFTHQHAAPIAAVDAGYAVRENDVARMLGVSLGLVRKWRRIGDGPKFAKLGGASVAYRIDDIRAFMDAAIARTEAA